MEDRSLVEESQKGDKDSFKELIAAYQTKLYNLAFYFLGNEHDAADLSQETWCRVFKQLNTFKFNCSFYTWVCKILRNFYLDNYVRKQYRKKEVPLNESINRISELEPSAGLEKEQLNKIIKTAIDKLQDDFRITLVLIDLQGFSYEEVAKITKVSLGTVRSRLSRARSKLREIFLKMGTF